MNDVKLTGLARLATGKNVLITLAVMMAGSTWLFNAGSFSQLVSFGAGPAPEETLSPAAVLPDYLCALGEQGRAIYQSHLVWDFLNPLLMAPFFALLIAWLIQKTSVSKPFFLLGVCATINRNCRTHRKFNIAFSCE